MEQRQTRNVSSDPFAAAKAVQKHWKAFSKKNGGKGREQLPGRTTMATFAKEYGLGT